MNSYYKVLEVLKGILEESEAVHTIVYGRTSDKDLFKKAIYPLVHIKPEAAIMNSSQQNVFEFSVAVLEQRDISKTQVEDKFISNDNLIDNHNLTYSILNFLVSRLRLQNNNDVEVINVSNAIPLMFTDNNLMDGWLLRISLAIPNTVINVC